MNINRLTQKAQAAAIAARDLTEAGGQAEIGTLHLVKVLLDQPGGVVPQLAERMGVDRAALDGALCVQVGRLPRVAGGVEPGLSRALRDTLVAVHDELGAFGDQFVSTEHVRLAVGLAPMPRRRWRWVRTHRPTLWSEANGQAMIHRYERSVLHRPGNRRAPYLPPWRG